MFGQRRSDHPHFLGRLAPGRIADRDRTARALAAEFLGTALFVFYSAIPGTSAWAIGTAYAGLVYGLVHVSGGQLNPVIPVAAICSGHITILYGSLYIAAQVLGGVVGALLEVALVPGVRLGHGGDSPGCFVRGPGVSHLQVFSWELCLTATFILVLYGVAVHLPGHGSLSPVAMGFITYTLIKGAARYTGAAFNPARVIGPGIVFLCTWPSMWVYLLGEVLGAILGAFIACMLYEMGFGFSRHTEGTEGTTREPLVGEGGGEPA